MFKKFATLLLATAALLGCSTTSTADHYPVAPASPPVMAAKVAPATKALRIVGNFKPGVDARLMDAISCAAEQFAYENPGFSVEAFSGYRAGDHRQHGKHYAIDVQIVDPNGNIVPNYQNARSFRLYEKLAQDFKQQIDAKYPALSDDARWGGYFSGKKGTYGAVDLMHFDLGGLSGLGMAGGSWENGLTKSQRALFPGVVSVGMGSGP